MYKLLFVTKYDFQLLNELGSSGAPEYPFLAVCVNLFGIMNIINTFFDKKLCLLYFNARHVIISRIFIVPIHSESFITVSEVGQWTCIGAVKVFAIST